LLPNDLPFFRFSHLNAFIDFLVAQNVGENVAKCIVVGQHKTASIIYDCFSYQSD